MKDQTKTKKQLIEELEELRRQSSNLKMVKTRLKHLRKPASDSQYRQTIFDSINNAVCSFDTQGMVIRKVTVRDYRSSLYAYARMILTTLAAVLISVKTKIEIGCHLYNYNIFILQGDNYEL